jgi:hypothetical protein
VYFVQGETVQDRESGWTSSKWFSVSRVEWSVKSKRVCRDKNLLGCVDSSLSVGPLPSEPKDLGCE